MVFTHGKGCYLFDAKGRTYLDFLSGIGVNALGYAHPKLVRVIREQAARAIHVSNLFHNEFQGPLAERLAAWTGLDRVFFTNSGTEAIEGALKLARAYGREQAGGAEKPQILALENSFHGRTFGALSITAPLKYRAPFAPLLLDVDFVRTNDIGDLERKFNKRVCALVVEPIQGEGGIIAVSEAFLRRARQLATERDAVLIADEIQCGLGRTGRPFAYQKFGVQPDIVVVAKPLAGGLPLGAFIARERFARAFSPGMHGTTFGGGPLACATALEFLRVVEEEGLLENVRRRGEEVRAGLERLKQRFGFIREIRGEGLMLGIELDVEGAPYVARGLRSGLIINCTHDRILRFLPPFIVARRHVEEFLTKLEAVLARPVRRASERPATEPAHQAAAVHAG